MAKRWWASGKALRPSTSTLSVSGRLCPRLPRGKHRRTQGCLRRTYAHQHQHQTERPSGTLGASVVTSHTIHLGG